jgi:hypothetical protein
MMSWLGMTSQAETLLEVQLEQAGIPFVREFRFGQRRHRADFLIQEIRWDEAGILIEVEGGTWIEGRHSRGKGFEDDCEKQALAVIAGYRYLRCTTSQVDDGSCLSWIRQALGVEAAA